MSKAWADRVRRENCVGCGADLSTKQKSMRQQACSRDCARATHGLPPGSTSYVCVGCSQEFQPNPGRPTATTYCSSKCARSHVKAEALSRHERECVECGTGFDPRTQHGRTSKNVRCPNCRTGPRAPLEWGSCADCGAEFLGDPQRRYCSRTCSQTSQYRVGRARRRLSDSSIDRVPFFSVADQCGGRCGICGSDVNLDLKNPHPLSATIDHIIPLSHPDSSHDLGNLQLAHLSCNSSKQDATADG